MKHTLIFLAIISLFSFNVHADWLEKLGLKKTGTNQVASILTNNFSQDQMVGALKQALDKGIKQSISSLGRTNGFLTNLNVRIPMPEKLASTEAVLRSIGQDKLADDFVVTMNHAAEQAVPAATSVFVDALNQLTIEDAKTLLTGSDDAATQFFRRTTQTNLAARFLPIVKEATANNKVTKSYKSCIEKAGSLAATNSLGGTFGSLLNKGETYLKNNAVDVDAYVTDKALDGLFKMLAEEEKKIRQNPAERTTELMQKVFAAVKK